MIKRVTSCRMRVRNERLYLRVIVGLNYLLCCKLPYLSLLSRVLSYARDMQHSLLPAVTIDAQRQRDWES